MNCPICNHSNPQIALESQDFSLTQAYFTIVHCSKCSLRFTSPVPSQDEIGQYYKFKEYISHTDVKEGWMNQMYHFVRTKAWKVTGLEPDALTREKALEIHKLNLKSTEAIFDLPENEYEVITMWHVLEHVHALKPYLHQCLKSLKYNGRLIIAVPNYTSFDAKFYQKYWAAYDLPRHLYHFSPKAMITLLNEMGFELVSMRPMWYDSFYVSLLSEKYKQSGKLGMLVAGMIGLLSNLFAIKDASKGSSIIYEFKKQSNSNNN